MNGLIEGEKKKPSWATVAKKVTRKSVFARVSKSTEDVLALKARR